ncbi:uncharacterized protein LOC143902067 isoform X2 [Temnothorax americanus]|uniref:uncharacterized protein LOC143902067 isoform X2 n=1 Tax=Temnothorax americanus TaxID=1964332 RepID=UPI004069129D
MVLYQTLMLLQFGVRLRTLRVIHVRRQVLVHGLDLLLHLLLLGGEDLRPGRCRLSYGRYAPDTLFATQLLHKYKAARDQQIAKSAKKTTIKNAERMNCQSQSVTEADDTEEITEEFSHESSQETFDFQEKDSFRWPHEAVILLLALYKEHEDEIKLGKMTMKKFWNMIASHLNKKEYNVTVSQCKSKMAGLKNTYKNVKDHNAKSGNNHKTWRYFDIMDEMFNKKPWMNPILTLDSSNPTTVPSPECDTENNSDTSNQKDPSSSKTTVRSTRFKQSVLLQKILTNAEENANERKRMHDEAMSRQDQLLDILAKIIKK